MNIHGDENDETVHIFDTMISNKNKKIPTIEEYMQLTYSKCLKFVKNEKGNTKGNSGPKKQNKGGDETMEEIPTIKNYSVLIQKNYNVQQLKKIVKYYKLKISGNKNELVNRIYCFLKLSSLIIPFQRVFRGYIQRKYNELHGPAFRKRELCTNQYDFLSMEEMKDLPFSQFFSYKDADGFIYGFDILSLYNLIQKSVNNERINKDLLNPYNRNVIDSRIILDVKQYIRLSKLLKIQVELQIQDFLPISQEKTTELQVIDLFHTVDSLGNYSNPDWFLSLNANLLNKFIRELIDIWNYRAQLDVSVKRLICPPVGNPFIHVNLQRLNNDSNVETKRRAILTVIDKMVKSGVDRDHNALGAYYVLSALTLVNESAAMALPWLFQSVSYF